MVSDEQAMVEGAPGALEEVRPHKGKSLLSHRSFLPLFLVQALGAFNDNLFKTAFVSLMTYILASKLEAEWGVAVKDLVAIAAAVFILPFAFLAPFAGQIADRVDKARMMRWVKFVEILLMIGASMAFLSLSVVLLFVLLFLMGAQSAFFSPIKYGVLPQYLHRDELVRGNGLIQAATFVAILGGTIAGTNLVLTPAGAEIVSGVIVAVAVIGWIASLFATPARASAELEPIRFASFFDGALKLRQLLGDVAVASVVRRFGLFLGAWLAIYALIAFTIYEGGAGEAMLDAKRWLLVGSAIFIYLLYLLWPSINDSLHCARRSRRCYNAIRAIAWFWFVGATYLAVLPTLTSVQLQGDQTVLTLLLAAFSIGVGLGSMLTGALNRKGVKIGFAPWGAIGIAIFSLDLAFAIQTVPAGTPACEMAFDPQSGALVPKVADACRGIGVFLGDFLGWRILMDFILLAMCAGVYLTPLNAVYQAEAPKEARGRVVACSNMIDSFFMALSSVAIVLLGVANLAEQEILGLMGVSGFFAAFAVARWAPDSVLGRIAVSVFPARSGDG